MNGIKYRKPEEMKDSGVQWIGKMPNIWELSYIKYHSEINNGYPFNSDNFTFEQGFPIVRIRDIIRNKTETNYVGKIEKDALIDNDDILIGMDGDFNLNVWQGGKALLNQRILRIRGNKSLFDGFIKYILPYPLKVINDLTYYTTVKHLSNKDVMDIKFCLPDIIEQQKIANFLDIKTAQFDSIIAKKELLIKKLEEVKKSLISEVVTGKVKIIDGEMVKRQPEEMKDSGVEWLGMIPKEWEVKRIKYLFSLRNERNNKSMDEVQILSLYTALGVKKQEEIENKTGNKVRTVLDYKIVYPKDIVVNIILAWMGAIGVSEDSGVISPAYDIYNPNVTVNSFYYSYLFRTSRFAGECFRYGKGIMLMRWRTYSDEFMSIYCCCPDKQEQDQIVNFLNTKIQKIELVVEKYKSQIEKLKQAKQSLISEAVTGKIDLREWEII